jgi:hypothetical protein
MFAHHSGGGAFCFSPRDMIEPTKKTFQLVRRSCRLLMFAGVDDATVDMKGKNVVAVAG